MPGDDNRLPTLDVIKKFGEGESWPQRLNFAHESPISLVDSTSRFFDDEESSMVWAFGMFTYVDPVPGVVVQERPLDLRSWGRDGVGQGLRPGLI